MSNQTTYQARARLTPGLSKVLAALGLGMAGLALVGLGVLARAGGALAWETVKVMPTISVRETYDSNVNLMGKGDFESSATPGVRVDLEKERMRGWVVAKGTAYKYLRLSDFDRIDQNYEVGIEVNATERVSANLKGGLVADHAFGSALDETGEQAPRRASRQVYSIKPSLTLALDEANSLTFFHAFTKTEYDTRDYTDSTSNTLGGLWGHRLNERTQLLLQLSGSKATTPSASQDSVSGMGGFEYALAETLKARVLGGASSLRSKADGQESRQASTYAAETSLEWQLEKLTTKAAYSRDMTLGITGDDLVRDKLSLNLALRATERLRLLLGGNMVLSKNTSSAQSAQKNRWTEISPGASYQLGENSSMTLGYAYGSSEDRLTDETKTRNRVYLDFSIAFP
ncbi:MAG: hypothetical protein Q8S17_06545 [Humidesulfovibrio sp.]|nr:hypothetical protein [Humidesulfovibrio sp.]